MEDEFRSFLTKFAAIFEGGNVLFLRLLLNDHCSGNLLKTNHTPIAFFNELGKKGYISYNPTVDVDILHDIAKTTEQQHALNLVSRFKKKHPKTVEGYNFTKGKPIKEYRKRLYKALIANTNPLPNMLAAYDKGHLTITNIWDLLFHLERNNVVVETKEESIEFFADLLDGNAKQILIGPPEAKQDSPSRSLRSSGKRIKNGEDHTDNAASYDENMSEGTICYAKKRKKLPKAAAVIIKANAIKQKIEQDIQNVTASKEAFQICVNSCKTKIEKYRECTINKVTEIAQEKNDIFTKKETQLKSKKNALDGAICGIALNDNQEEMETFMQHEHIIKNTEEEIQQYSESNVLIDEEHLKPTFTENNKNFSGILRISDCRYAVNEDDTTFSITTGQPFTVNVARKKSKQVRSTPSILHATLKYRLRNETCSIDVIDKKHGKYRITTDRCNKEGDWMMEVMTDQKYYIKGSPVIINVEPTGLVNDAIALPTIPGNQCITDVVLLDTSGSMLVSTEFELFKFNEPGHLVTNIKAETPMVNRVYHLMSDDNGYIVYSNSQGSIVKCDDQLREITQFGKEMLKMPLGVTVHNETLYVADMQAHCVFKFNVNNGHFLSKIGSFGTEEGKMFHPKDVALSNEGNLLVVTDFGNHRIQMFDVNGKFIKTLVSKGEEDGKVLSPHGVTVDKYGNIIVSSQQRIQLFDKNGVFIKRIDDTSDGIDLPSAITVISERPRRLAVVNSGKNNIKVYNY